MNEYLTTKEQTRLLSLPFDTEELKMLDKNSVSRIQVISFKGVKTLKSIEDNFSKIRIVILSLLIKIFTNKNAQNQQRLNRLKDIIYKGSVQKIVEEKGIQKQHLLKSMAENVNGLKVGNDAEIQTIRLFNCSPFFDETLMSAIQQHNPKIINNDCELSSWLLKELKIKILWKQECLLQESADQLCLIGIGEDYHSARGCQSEQCRMKTFKQYYRFSSEINGNADENMSMQNSGMKQTRFTCPTSPDFKFNGNFKQKIPNSLYMSIESVSPSIHSINNQSQKQNKAFKANSPFNLKINGSIGLFDSVNTQNFRKSRELIEYQNRANRPIKVKRKTNQKDGGSSIWSLLCCRDGREGSQ